MRMTNACLCSAAPQSSQPCSGGIVEALQHFQRIPSLASLPPEAHISQMISECIEAFFGQATTSSSCPAAAPTSWADLFTEDAVIIDDEGAVIEVENLLPSCASGSGGEPDACTSVRQAPASPHAGSAAADDQVTVDAETGLAELGGHHRQAGEAPAAEHAPAACASPRVWVDDIKLQRLAGGSGSPQSSSSSVDECTAQEVWLARFGVWRLNQGGSRETCGRLCSGIIESDMAAFHGYKVKHLHMGRLEFGSTYVANLAG